MSDNAKKPLSLQESLFALHAGLREKITAFEQTCIELRKKETEALAKKSPPGRKKEVEELKAKGLPASEAFGIAWKQHNEKGKPTKKGDQNEMAHVAAPLSGGYSDMGMQASEDEKLSAYAKSELCKTCKSNKAMCKCGMAMAKAVVEDVRKKGSVLPGDKPEKKQAGGEGSGGLKKAAPAMGAPKAPAAPKAGGMPKLPKIPGPKAPMAGAKPAAAGKAPKMPKTPAMGAGSPQMKAEPDLSKNAIMGYGSPPPAPPMPAPPMVKAAPAAPANNWKGKSHSPLSRVKLGSSPAAKAPPTGHVKALIGRAVSKLAGNIGAAQSARHIAAGDAKHPNHPSLAHDSDGPTPKTANNDKTAVAKRPIK